MEQFGPWLVAAYGIFVMLALAPKLYAKTIGAIGRKIVYHKFITVCVAFIVFCLILTYCLISRGELEDRKAVIDILIVAGSILGVLLYDPPYSEKYLAKEFPNLTNAQKADFARKKKGLLVLGATLLLAVIERAQDVFWLNQKLPIIKWLESL